MDAQLHTTLKSAGFSVTTPRAAIFSALQNHEPQSIGELAQACPAIDRATLYRTIELFEKLGIVRRLYIGWKYKLELTDTFSHHHHHFACTGCGKVTILQEDQRIEKYLTTLAKAEGFVARDHEIEIRGLCANCIREKPSKTL